MLRFTYDMKAHKRSHDWYVALSHTVTSGFAIPLILAAAYAYALVPLLGIRLDTSTSALMSGIVSVCSIWLGVRYSAVYIRRTYSPESRKRIVGLASVFFGAILLLFLVPQYLAGEGEAYRTIELLSAFASVAVFHYASKRELLKY